MYYPYIYHRSDCGHFLYSFNVETGLSCAYYFIEGVPITVIMSDGFSWERS